ncbi:hypothetical protein BaRGS_00000032 [Batillaria attramentaria]|uniref:Uncharacterized protein n=1 Tax=Batillaria attramentaria TaxID=370345 RepID=A0ABD0MAR6_9CAEN
MRTIVFCQSAYFSPHRAPEMWSWRDGGDWREGRVQSAGDTVRGSCPISRRHGERFVSNQQAPRQLSCEMTSCW